MVDVSRLRDVISKGDIEPLRLKMSDARALEIVKLTNRLPHETRIEDMGLTQAGQLALTEAAIKLTKRDLVALGEGKITPETEGLTVADIKSIQIAFGTAYYSRAAINATAANGVSCCCCTPCCCAAAVTDKRAA